MKVAVVGHIEWATFVTVDRLPAAGEIVHSKRYWQEPGGGGSVASLQLAQLADECLFFTSVGNDEQGRETVEKLEAGGVKVYASVNGSLPTRQVFVHIDDDHERTITVIGDTLQPSGNDTSLPWHELASVDAVYFTQGDTTALQAARRAPVVVATARVLDVLQQAAIPLDALVRSRQDSSEHYEEGELKPAPGMVVTTDGLKGGITDTGLHYAAEAIPPDRFKDTYGCGDSFAAGLTYALGLGLQPAEALSLAAHCGAQAAQRRGVFQI